MDNDAGVAIIDLRSLGMSRRYEELLDRSADTFIADDRVVALFVVGSLSRGEADASSDLDPLVSAAHDDAHRPYRRLGRQGQGTSSSHHPTTRSASGTAVEYLSGG